jgi:hypothetical protein
MSSRGYRLLGYAVWHGGRWYVRRRLPSVRKIAISGLAGVAGLTAAAVAIARRAIG